MSVPSFAVFNDWVFPSLANRPPSALNLINESNALMTPFFTPRVLRLHSARASSLFPSLAKAKISLEMFMYSSRIRLLLSNNIRSSWVVISEA